MKRIFIGLAILMFQFVNALPWEEFFRAVGISDLSEKGLALVTLGSIVTQLTVIAVFLRKTQLRERLALPTPGLWMITIGMVLSVGLWVFVMSTVTLLLAAVYPDTFTAFVVLMVFSSQYATAITVCNVIANTLLVVGFLRLFTNLIPDEAHQPTPAASRKMAGNTL